MFFTYDGPTAKQKKKLTDNWYTLKIFDKKAAYLIFSFHICCLLSLSLLITSESQLIHTVKMIFFGSCETTFDLFYKKILVLYLKCHV